MSRVCTHCGNELPREDARFCNSCGKAVSASPSASQSSSAAKESSSNTQKRREKPILREQLAHQPRPRATSRIAQDDLPGSSVSWPPPVTHVSVKESSPQKNENQPIQSQKSPASDAPSVSPRPASVERDERELRTKSWEPEEDASLPDMSLEDMPTQQNSIAQLPISSLPEPEQVKPHTVSSAANSMSSKHRNEVEQLNTVPITPILATPSTSSAPRRKSRAPLVTLAALFCAFLIGSVVWALIAQPFSVPSVTKPMQDFKNNQLGVGLSYPSDWRVQHDASSAHFADSSNTAQVSLVMSNPGSQDPTQYLQQQAKKMSMTGTKVLTPVSFAGESWRQIQGSVQQDGVNYTETLLATVHGEHLFLLTQTAPQSVYTDEENITFAKIRASLHFLS